MYPHSSKHLISSRLPCNNRSFGSGWPARWDRPTHNLNIRTIYFSWASLCDTRPRPGEQTYHQRSVLGTGSPPSSLPAQQGRSGRGLALLWAPYASARRKIARRGRDRPGTRPDWPATWPRGCARARRRRGRWVGPRPRTAPHRTERGCGCWSPRAPGTQIWRSAAPWLTLLLTGYGVRGVVFVSTRERMVAASESKRRNRDLSISVWRRGWWAESLLLLWLWASWKGTRDASTVSFYKRGRHPFPTTCKCLLTRWYPHSHHNEEWGWRALDYQAQPTYLVYAGMCWFMNRWCWCGGVKWEWAFYDVEKRDVEKTRLIEYISEWASENAGTCRYAFTKEYCTKMATMISETGNWIYIHPSCVHHLPAVHLHQTSRLSPIWMVHIYRHDAGRGSK